MACAPAAILPRPGDTDPARDARARTHLERVDAGGMRAHRAAWSDLAARALEPNVFLEPAFMLALTDRLADGAKPHFLLAWDEDAGTGTRLMAMLPLRRRQRGARIARGFRHDLTALGRTPDDRRAVVRTKTHRRRPDRDVDVGRISTLRARGPRRFAEVCGPSPRSAGLRQARLRRRKARRREGLIAVELAAAAYATRTTPDARNEPKRKTTMTRMTSRATILACAVLAAAGSDAQVSPHSSGNPSFYSPSRINPFDQFKSPPAVTVAPLIPTSVPRHLHRHGHDLLPC